MSTSASLDTPSIVVEPGSTGSAVLQVHNAGQTVESYRLEVVGPDDGWLSIEPAGLSLYPGTSGTATVYARPPRDYTVLAGERPFGVRVVPVDHPDDAVTPEAMLAVLPFADLGGELLPRASSGSSRGQHRLAIDNRGNTAVEVYLRGHPATEQIRLAVTPETIVAPPGEAVFARVRARPVRRLWRGAPVTHPFQLTATAPGGESVQVDGGYQQQPLLPRWLPRAVAAALVAVLLLLGFWYAAVRPAIQGTARDVATNQVASQVPSAVSSVLANPAPGGGPRPSRSTSPGGGPGGQPGGSGGTPTPSATSKPPPPRRPVPAAAGRTPTSSRIEVRDAPDGGTPSSDNFPVPARRVLEVTDIFVQNPQGDAGTLVISGQGGRALLVASLENFRDDPYYFSTPLEIPAGSALTVTVTCRQVGTPVGAPRPTRCFESVLVTGTLRTTPAPAVPN
jgi:hypothetical protein